MIRFPAIAAMSLGSCLPNDRKRKRTTALWPLALFISLIALHIPSSIAQERAEATSKAQLETYRAAAWAHFKKRCEEQAGEKISRTVTNVDGILLLRPRERATDQDLQSQFWMGDPYGHDSILADSELRNYLSNLNENDTRVIRETSRPGYRFVEVKEPDSSVTRYKFDKTRTNVLSESVAKPLSKYGVTWQDISTEEDRKYWVAGGRLQVLELTTGAVLAERVGYLIEPEFGARNGGRQPWLHARLVYSDVAACPSFKSRALPPVNRIFVEKVLRPKRNRDGE